MRYLLDTHVFNWFRITPRELGPKTLSLLRDPQSEMVVSAVSALEVAQLVHSGRLVIPCDAEMWIGQTRRIFNAPESRLDSRIAAEAYRLPGEFHRDPADRILVATARLEGWTLVTADRRILDYPHVRSRNARK
ncbi:MAG: type II toxin-antitoxin system VapC family toxin [Verrucomicrobiae bacterium]|nr:type II toxin-antitoxin system VapC family toxin [Verrucomicrobiae bacterium]MCP5523935.1 type II toxin-antitoxin system VapC family toxin [Verrucomicrobiales bacterium]